MRNPVLPPLDVRVEDEKAKRWAVRAAEGGQIEREAELLEEERAALLVDIGVVPDMDESGLFLLADGLRRWQAAHQTCRGAEAARDAAVRAHDDMLEAINRVLTPFGYEPAPAAADDFLWWLIVADDGTGKEGSWGEHSGGSDRRGPGNNGASNLCLNTDKDLTNACPP